MKTNQIEKLNVSRIGEPSQTRSVPGRVVHDSRGNAKWDWAVSTAVLAKKTIAELMNTLEVPTLAIESEREIAAGRAGDPYNRMGRRF